MNDIFEEIERVGRSGSRGMGKRLRSASVKDALVEASRKGRRRYAAGRGVAALVAVAAIGGGLIAGIASARDVRPATDPDARYGEVPGYWSRGATGWSCEPLEGALTPGATYADEAAARLGLAADSILIGPDGEEIVLAPGQTFTQETAPGAHFDVTWRTGEEYDVFAFLLGVKDGIAQGTTLSIGEMNRIPGDGVAGVETMGLTLEWCRNGLPSYEDSGITTAGTYELYTVVQLIDPANPDVAVATVTSKGVGGVDEITFVPVPPPDPSEDALALASRVELEGVPLDRLIGSGGIRPAARCDEVAEILRVEGPAVSVIDRAWQIPGLAVRADRNDQILLGTTATMPAAFAGATIDFIPESLYLYFITANDGPRAVSVLRMSTAFTAVAGDSDSPPIPADVSRQFVGVNAECSTGATADTIQPGMYDVILVASSEWMSISIDGEPQPGADAYAYLGQVTVTD